MLTTTVSYQLLAKDLERSLDTASKTPAVERASEYYLGHISDAKTIDDFLSNDRLYGYAMKAFGLEDMTYAKAFMRKVLEGGVEDSESFANRLSDKRYRDFAEAFDFAGMDDLATSFTRTQQGTVDRYVRQTLEETAGESNEGVRLALYFQRKAADIDSPYDILADTALLKVVQTALQIPAETGSQDIDRQAALIEKRLDLEDLQDPKKLEAFLRRFTGLWEVSNRSSASVSPSTALIVSTQPLGISADLLQSLQNLKLGGA